MEIILYLLAAAGTAVLILTAAGIYFYRLGVMRRSKAFLRGNPDLSGNDPMETWYSDSAWLQGQPLQEVEIKSADGLKLHACLLEAEIPTGKTAVVIHGYSGKGADMNGFARLYHEKAGFNVLMTDSRGHGGSQGSYIGFGWPDRLDYLKWVDWVAGRYGKSAQILLHGVSMGGATVLMVGGEKLPEGVMCLVSDCAYTSAKDILTYQLKRMFKLPPFPMIPVTSLICRLRAGYWFGEASALEQVKKCRVPVLFIHGLEDRFVPVEMAHALFDACKSDKELMLVPGAGHGNSFYTDREEYEKKLLSFINKYMI